MIFLYLLFSLVTILSFLKDLSQDFEQLPLLSLQRCPLNIGSTC